MSSLVIVLPQKINETNDNEKNYKLIITLNVIN